MAAIVVGWALRLRQFSVRRSLWLDEALVARQIVERSYAGLLQPLEDNQGAPPGFLWIERSAVLAWGPNEYALRLLPLAAGLALLPLVWLLARRLLDPPAAAVAAVLAASSPTLVRYTTEVKQYGVDATVAVALVLLGLAVARRRAPVRPVAVAMAIAGAVAVWMSHPAAFVLAGTGSVLAVDAARRRDPHRLVAVASMAAVWAVSFGALYLASLRRLGRSEGLVAYWAPGFVPRPLGVGGTAAWLWSASTDYVSEIGRFPAPVPLVVAALVGTAVVAARSSVRAAVLLWAPVPFAVAAAALQRYPFRGRLVLFVLPLALVALAGVAAVERPRWRLAGLAVVAVLAAVPAAEALRMAVDPPLISHSRPVFEHVRQHRGPGDAVYVHDVTIGPYRFYGPLLGLEADARTDWRPASACPPPGRVDLAPADGRSRVWVVFAHTLSIRPRDEVELVRAQFDAVARRVSTFTSADASATLYDFGAEPTDAAADARRRTDELGCLAVTPL